MPQGSVGATGIARVDALTGVRALAALWVVAYHGWLVAGRPVLGAGSSPVALAWIGRVATALASMGWLGVDLFFVLSGFVLTWQALGDPSQPFVRGSFWHDAGSFMRRRVLRVHPAYIATLTVLLPLGFYGLAPMPAGIADVVLHVAMLHNFVPAYVDTINGVYWSMPFEFEFYLLFPLFIVPVMRGRAALLLAIALAVAIAMRVAAHVGGTGALPAQLPWRIDEFVAGMAAAALARRGVLSNVALARIAWVALIVLAAGALVIARIDSAWWQPGALPFARMLWIDASAAALFLGLSAGTGAVACLFATRPVVWLGAISYSIYLWHLPVLQIVRPRIVALTQGLPAAADAAIALGTIVAISALSYYLVEAPFHAPSRDAPAPWRNSRVRFRTIVAWAAAIIAFALVAYAPSRG